MAYCVCASIASVDILLFQQVFKPEETIEVTLLLGKMQGSINEVSISLSMELSVFSLTEPPKCLKQIEKMLQTVILDSKKLKSIGSR
jgi:hypothetical protein